MDHKKALYELGSQAWDYRKTQGFLKSLPADIRMRAAKLVIDGSPMSQVAKVLGVTNGAVHEWRKSYQLKNQDIGSSSTALAQMTEVAVVDTTLNYEIKLTSEVHGCRVELCGTDYSLLQRLLRKLG